MPDEPDDPTEAQIAAFEDALDDLTEKELLIGILAELKWLRVALTSGEPDDGEAVYACRTCGKRVGEADRERHAVEVHNLPPGIDYAEEYERVDA